MKASRRAAGAGLAYAVAPGVQGGMGHHPAQVLEACARISSLTVCGPEPLHTRAGAEAARFVAPPAFVSPWQRRYTWRRYLHGPFQLEQDRRFGRWLARPRLGALGATSMTRSVFPSAVGPSTMALVSTSPVAK